MINMRFGVSSDPVTQVHFSYNLGSRDGANRCRVTHTSPSLAANLCQSLCRVLCPVRMQTLDTVKEPETKEMLTDVAAYEFRLY